MQRVAIDAGGTFTDLVILDESGRLSTRKVLSNPDDPAAGLLAALDGAVDLGRVDTVVNGTTVGLNAVLSRRGTRVLLITTEGFRDVLALGRAERTDVWELRYRRPAHLVDGEDICTVDERVLANGSVDRPLELAELEDALARIAAHDIRSVAVCLLHATSKPVHELAIRDALLAARPELMVSLSHEVVPEVGEYERFSSTVVNAYMATVVGDYLRRAEQSLQARDYERPLLVMRSSGGVTSARSARRRPIQTLVSGPSGGVVGAEALARALDRDHLLAIDMGGTSLDASVIVDGRMATAPELEIDGLPVRMPVVDLITVGAGGGSVAWLQGNGLRVGPHSAGARPGPACYGLGGAEPTVTDANVVLGRIAATLADGAIRLDVDAARRAFAPLAGALGMSIEAAAEAVIAITDARMADALRTITVQRGHDPRDFALLAFGGAGPVHAAALAEELEIDTVVVPPVPGVFSAWGMLHAPIRHDLSEPLLADTHAVDPARLQALHARLADAARALLAEDGVDPDRASYVAALDMRYAGQQFTVRVDGVAGDELDVWDARFREVYTRAHGRVAGDPPTEIVNVCVTGRGPVAAVSTGAPDGAGDVGVAATTGVTVAGRLLEAKLLRRRQLAGRELAGPAVLVDDGATLFVPPGWTARTGPLHTVAMTRGAA